MAIARLITIEGVEGAGKSTVRQLVHEKLNALSVDHILTREPGGTAIAETIREILLKKHDEAMCAETELLLVFAGRAQHIKQVIQPALEQGRWVVSDRFTDASYAYQGAGRGISETDIASLEKLVQHDLQPDLTFLLDIPVEQGLQRIERRAEKDRIEVEAMDFFNRIRNCYLKRAELFPQRFRIVNAAQELSMIKKDIDKILEEYIKITSALPSSRGQAAGR